MSGRYRALLLAVASSGSLLFAWIGASVVALVVLRKGSREGLWLVLWASLPALLVTKVSGDSSALAMLLGTAVLALVLRASVSLALTAVASTGVAVVTGLGLLVFGQPLLVELAGLFAQFFAALETQTLEAGGQPLGLAPPTTAQLAGMMGTANGALSFLCLALARYWQAALYNPGGFGSEFRALQLPKTLVWALVMAAVAFAAAGLAFRSWGAAMLLPLTIAGFALLHARARHRRQGSFWMSGIYVAWLVFDAAKLGLVGLVLADTVMNFRDRWQDAESSTLGEGSDTKEEQDVSDDDHQDDTKD
ncbi:hypothetical protein R0135_15380 [Congregibacter variabilis]|uniref:Membrane protein (DUF2232) n=1 Tax=Congregibacter variabilis TaxID=3081200 RepID=A0ABZ0I3P7_9GAMM|nr:hypothetical protein R0135_15380 [Congregibacter sp. IMCC43200]